VTLACVDVTSMWLESSFTAFAQQRSAGVQEFAIHEIDIHS
jgi:hypothetical protein